MATRKTTRSKSIAPKFTDATQARVDKVLEEVDEAKKKLAEESQRQASEIDRQGLGIISNIITTVLEIGEFDQSEWSYSMETKEFFEREKEGDGKE